jgi:hypothetical protein
MWQGLQTFTDYKGKTSHVTDTDASFPQRGALEDCRLLISVTILIAMDRVKTFKFLACIGHEMISPH